MKLLLFINSLRNGGAERVMAKLANHWCQMGHEVTVATLMPISSDQYYLSRNVRRISLLAGDPSANLLVAIWSNIVRLRRLRRLVKQISPDCMVSFMPTANILSYFACIGLSVKLVISERNHPPNFPLGVIRNLLQNAAYPRAHALVSLTEISADWFRIHLGCTNVIVIPNAVTLPIAVSSPMVDPIDYLPEDARLVLSIGRLVDDKQMDHVMKAFASSNDPSVRLAVIGAGPERAKLEKLADTLNITRRTVFLERVGNVEDWYRRAEVFVSAATREGFPNVLLEALACGCPAIAYDCPTGPAEIIEDGVNGYLVPINDLSLLAERLKYLLEQESLRKRLGERAREITKVHSKEVFFRHWDNLVLEESV